MYRVREMIAAGLVAALFLASCSPATRPAMTPVITIWATAPLPTSDPPRKQATATSVTPTAQPTATPRQATYTVLPDDTLWDIAVTFGVSLDEIVAANPDIDPELLHPGQVINIPGGNDVIAQMTPLPEVTPRSVRTNLAGKQARVADDAEGLRLRRGPGSSFSVITMLEALTALTILAQSEDGQWFEVIVSGGKHGWVMARYVDTNPQPLAVSAAATTTLSETFRSTAAQNLPAYLSDFTPRAMEIFRKGQELGNRANVFAVIGDSNSASPLFLEPFDTGNYNLGPYSSLEDTIRFFKGSFRFTTVAAVVGFDTTRLMDPSRANSEVCLPGESPLACEYRRKRPSVALILIGTNDTGNWRNFEANFRPIVEYTVAKGIIPVLMTKGDDLEETRYHSPPNYINSIIVKVGQEYGVPLLDLQQVVAQLPAHGFISDGFHYNIPPDSRTADFTGIHMNYGYTLRNLTALQSLDAVRRIYLGQ